MAKNAIDRALESIDTQIRELVNARDLIVLHYQRDKTFEEPGLKKRGRKQKGLPKSDDTP